MGLGVLETIFLLDDRLQINLIDKNPPIEVENLGDLYVFARSEVIAQGADMGLATEFERDRKIWDVLCEIVSEQTQLPIDLLLPQSRIADLPFD